MDSTGPNRRRRAFLLIGAATTCAMVVLILAVEILHATQTGQSFWLRHGLTPRKAKWCEAKGADLTNFMIEPSNARSDYTYAAFGIALMCLGVWEWYENAHGKTPHKALLNPLRRHPWLTALNGLFNLVHAVGTWLAHSCDCSIGGRMDVAGMLAVIIYLAAYPLAHLAVLRCLPQATGAPGVYIYALVPIAQTIMWAVVMSGTRIDTGNFTTILIVVALVANILLVLQLRRMQRAHIPLAKYLASTLLLFLIGMTAWQLDTNGIWCFPRSFFQGHAAWHVFTCAALVAAVVGHRLPTPPLPSSPTFETVAIVGVEGTDTEI